MPKRRDERQKRWDERRAERHERWDERKAEREKKWDEKNAGRNKSSEEREADRVKSSEETLKKIEKIINDYGKKDNPIMDCETEKVFENIGVNIGYTYDETKESIMGQERKYFKMSAYFKKPSESTNEHRIKQIEAGSLSVTANSLLTNHILNIEEYFDNKLKDVSFTFTAEPTKTNICEGIITQCKDVLIEYVNNHPEENIELITYYAELFTN